MPQYKFRNNYRVPAQKEVVVETPQGIKRYGPGMFVPPSQLGNARVKDKPSGSGGGNSGSKEDMGPSWDEILSQFKMTDISNPQVVNRASYNLRQYLPFPVKTSSSKVHPVSRFGSELALANLSNSVPGLKTLFSSLNPTVLVVHPDDEQMPTEHLVGKNFSKIGQVDLDKNIIKLWQHPGKEQSLIETASKFVADKLGLISATHLFQQVQNAEGILNDLGNKLQQAQQLLKNAIHEYASRNKGKAPKPGANQNIDSLTAQVQQLAKNKNDISQVTALLGSLSQAVMKEKGFNGHIDTLLKETPSYGVSAQFAKALSHANTFSLGNNKTFDQGLENLAATHPDTMDNIRNILQFLSQAAVSEGNSGEGQEEGTESNAQG